MPLVLLGAALRFGGVGSIATAVRVGACGAFLAFVVCVGGCGASRSELRASPSHLSAFAVLNSARTRADTVPSKVAHYLLQLDEPSLSPVEIQDARTVLPNRRVWLVPAPEGMLCLVRMIYPLVLGVHGEHLPPAVGGKCSSEKGAQEGRLMASQSLSVRPTERVPMRVYGIVPDGVRNVLARSSRDVVRIVRVQRNAYEFSMVNPQSVSFATGQGRGRGRYVVSIPSIAGAKQSPSSSSTG